MGTSTCARKKFSESAFDFTYPIADNLGFQNRYDRTMLMDGTDNKCKGAQEDNRRTRIRTRTFLKYALIAVFPSRYLVSSRPAKALGSPGRDDERFPRYCDHIATLRSISHRLSAPGIFEKSFAFR